MPPFVKCIRMLPRTGQTLRRALSIAPFAQYLKDMSGFFFIAMIAAMLMTLAILGMGLFSMVKGGEFNRKYGNKLMRARVIMQGIAIALFALAFIAGGK